MNLVGESMTFNAAILSGVNPINSVNRDSNPLRYLEDWTNRRLTMQTSFVINCAPTTSNSNFVAPGTGAYNSTEYFRYPIESIKLDINFNEPQGLPPGTPTAIDILNDSIDRKYREGEKENIQQILS